MLDLYIQIGCIFFGLIAVSLIFGKYYIQFLRSKNKAGQKVLDLALDTHKLKEGTTTLGATIFILPLVILFVISLSLKLDFVTHSFIAASTILIIFSLMGLADDLTKFFKKTESALKFRNWGLRKRDKFILSMLIAIGSFVIFYYCQVYNNFDIQIFSFNLKLNIYVFAPLFVFTMIAASHGSNFVDGLDGLLGFNAIINLATLSIVAFLRGDIGLFSFDLFIIAGLIGFLFYNIFPAKVFMGDFGSLAIGPIIALNAFFLKIEFLLLIFAALYLFEIITWIMQRYWFKYTRKVTGTPKRLFLMTPIHHHFEKLGWHETKVTTVFTIGNLIANAIGLALFIFIW